MSINCGPIREVVTAAQRTLGASASWAIGYGRLISAAVGTGLCRTCEWPQLTFHLAPYVLATFEAARCIRLRQSSVYPNNNKKSVRGRGWHLLCATTRAIYAAKAWSDTHQSMVARQWPCEDGTSGERQASEIIRSSRLIRERKHKGQSRTKGN